MSILVVLAASTLAFGLEMNVNVNMTDEITPETGDKLPPFSQTFPGCDCTWMEPRGFWSCAGTIAYPPEVQGQECGCCGMSCQKSNRKSDDECLAGGYDQKAEMEAERKRLAELLKGADFLLGDDLPAFIVELGEDGQCTTDKLVKACKTKDATPICDHTSYRGSGKCYTPGYSNSGSAARFFNKHFSHWASHRQLMNLDVDDEIFYGMCFVTSNGQQTLYPTGTGHGWSSGGTIAPRAGLSKPKQTVHVNTQMNNGQGELGRWRTLCVKKDPNPAR